MQIVKKAVLTPFFLLLLSSTIYALDLSGIISSTSNAFSDFSQIVPFYQENFAIIDFLILWVIFFLITRFILEPRFNDTGVTLAFVLAIIMSFSIVYLEVQRDASFIASYINIFAPIALVALAIVVLRWVGLTNKKSLLFIILLTLGLISIFSEKFGFKLPQPFRAIFMIAALLLIAYLLYLLYRKISRHQDVGIEAEREHREKEEWKDIFKGQKDNTNININLGNQQGNKEVIKYQQRQRTALDLQKSYDFYLFKIFRKGLTPHERTGMLNALNIIQSQAQKQGCNIKGKKPWEIAQTLRANGLI